MPQKTINSPEELQSSIKAIVSAMLKDPGLAKVAAVNPIQALSQLGYHISSKPNGSIVTVKPAAS